MEYSEVMTSTLGLDCYTGETCDQHKKQWIDHCRDGDIPIDGDRLSISMDGFPCGTKVVILEPKCPNCSQPRSVCAPCDEGFDWDAWDEAEYS